MWKLQENVLGAEDIKVLADFISTTKRFTQFEKVNEFERAWSNWQNIDYSIFVNSGSSADLIMLDAVKEHYNIEDNAEVLVPAVTWTTNITSVIQSKMKPVFVDINLNDFAFDYNLLEKAITSKTKIILVTHLIGIPANMTKIREIADKYDLIVLEDCCESHGAKHLNKKIGNWSDASTFSFYWGHHMTTVEGGMICTQNEELKNLFLLKRSHGLARELPEKYHEKYRTKYPDIDFNFLFLTLGYNVRNTEFNAVLGINQLPKLDSYVEIRNNNYHEFIKILEPIKELLHLPDSDGISSFCLPFIFKNKKNKKKLQEILIENSIEFRPIIGGNLLRQPCFKRYGNYLDFKNAEIVHNNGFYIGNNQFVNSDRLNRLTEIVKYTFE
jgi:CDP-4-dehydro-6-deoxyglucose reductase, E1